MADRIHRVTMFKMPKEEDRQRMLEQYRQMAKDNQKASSTLAYFITQRPSPRDGKPYILSMTVGPAEDDPRSQGYTLVSKSEFASMEDMRYFENECPAHGEVRSLIKALTVDGILTVYFKAQATGGIEA
ncbi:hypothetical protein ACO1O0_005576 [Amphichorda felina]